MPLFKVKATPAQCVRAVVVWLAITMPRKSVQKVSYMNVLYISYALLLKFCQQGRGHHLSDMCNMLIITACKMV